MPGRTGTHDISSLMAANLQSAAEYGLDTINEVLQNDLRTHQTIVNQLVAEFMEPTTDRQRISGASSSGEMLEVDEYGGAPTQREQVGGPVGFPLRKFQYNLGWTNLWFKTKTPRDMALAQLNAEKAHLRRIQKEIKKAIFGSANYSFRDFLVDNFVLAVKRFHNADGAAIPDGPNGEVFDGTTHTHIFASAGWSATVLTNAINTVVEHGFGGQVRVYINVADEAAVRALTGFYPYYDPRLIVANNITLPGNRRLDISRMDNRPIGLFGAAEVWVKPWVPALYSFVFDNGTPAKPLVFRQRNQAALRGLRIAAENDDYPLLARFMEDEFGVAVWNRANGAVYYAGGAAWVDPNIP